MFKKIKICRCCKNKNLIKILDLGMHPLANSYVSKPQKTKKFPLILMLCNKCFHLQISVSVNPNLLFKNYLYVSGTTKTLNDYFEYFAKFSIDRFKKINKKNPLNVLDIACNDGSQLDKFKNKKIDTFGIDPAENLYVLSSKKHNVFCGYIENYNPKKKFDIIIAQNVFAHVDDLDVFLSKVKQSMGKESVFYIQTSQANMLLNNEFDTIYHEHLSFFNSLSMKKVLKKHNLFLNNVFKTSVHGTSYVFEISMSNKIGNISDVLMQELENGLFDVDFYIKYSKKCLLCVKNLKKKIDSYKKKKYKIIGYGAAAKGNTLLNFSNISLDYIVDDNPLKQGMYTPGMNIHIVSIEKLNEFSKKDKICFIPLAWNFYEEIKNRIKKFRNFKSDKIIKYFPFYSEEML
jgi:2-polyprenyl-3-methyl-5-hydroxy-6-metoxy-1,4-benzoquinol methylase